MKKITQKEKDGATEFLNNHIWNLLNSSTLSHYTVGFSFGTGENNQDFRGSKPASMTMETDHEYFRAMLVVKEDWFFESWREGKYEDLLSILCHEVAHILTSEMPDKLKLRYSGESKYYQERLTESVGRLIGRVYEVERGRRGIDMKTGRYAKRKGKNKN